MDKPACIVMWFRQDLRLLDNPALLAAARRGRVLPIYILEDDDAGAWRMGSANRVWLHHALLSLSRSLQGHLNLHRGSAAEVFADLRTRFDIQAVCWNRCYEPWRVSRDTELKKYLQNQGIEAVSYNGSLLWEPWEILKADGTPYKVFTPFYRKGCLSRPDPRSPVGAPSSVDMLGDPASLSVADLDLLPAHLWHADMMANWHIGEDGAQAALDRFLDAGLAGYKTGRNHPARPHVSRLSPYLQTGEISPNTVWHRARMRAPTEDLDHFCSELGWREFAYSLLYHNPTFPERNFQKKFDCFPWREDPVALTAWQRGRTGIPIIDAGMRELWQTGHLHNRLRMIVASFLTKNLMIDWRRGEDWFWETLVDADLANNSAGWQWVAGSGVDAAPYFRIFNPVTQAERFDEDGAYIRRFVPELQMLPDRYLAAPWTAPADILTSAGIQLGTDYPHPLVDLKSSRMRALEAFKSL